MEAVNVVTAGLVEDQPSPMHTKEFQTLSEFQSVNLDHETGNLLRGIVNFLVWAQSVVQVHFKENSFIIIIFYSTFKKVQKMFTI